MLHRQGNSRSGRSRPQQVAARTSARHELEAAALGSPNSTTWAGAGGTASCWEDGFDLSTHQVVVGDVRLSLAEFLRDCANRVEQEDIAHAPNDALIPLLHVFLQAGLEALKAATHASNWIQVGLQLGPRQSFEEVYRLLASTARELLDHSAINNFFFMHKPPGLRVRFETAGPGLQAFANDLYERLDHWCEEGVVERIVPAVYEPEMHLFGGPVSMRSVHRLFTIDSLTWLDYHVLAAREGEGAGPAWALSLLMLSAVFAGLDIRGWEDLDVWDRVRRKTGRRLHDKALTHGGFAEVAAGIRSGWRHQELLLGQLSPRVRAIGERYREAVEPMTARWFADYFATRQAYIGPREAAAFFTIFHWNRGGISLVRQALLTEALAAREAD